MHVGFFGPRTLDQRGLALLSEFFPTIPENIAADMTVVTGGAQGFDFAAAHLARQHGFEVHLVLPTRQYVDWFYFGKGHQPHLLGKPESMEKLLCDAGVSVEFVAPPFTKGSNFLRNTRLAQQVSRSVTLSDAPTTVGTKHCLSEHFRLGTAVKFLA